MANKVGKKGVNRRTFLKTTAAAGMATVLPAGPFFLPRCRNPAFVESCRSPLRVHKCRRRHLSTPPQKSPGAGSRG